MGIAMAVAGAAIALFSPRLFADSNVQLMVTMFGVIVGYYGFRKMQAGMYRNKKK